MDQEQRFAPNVALYHYLTSTDLTLMQAPDAAEGDTVVQLKFRAPPAGLHLLQVCSVGEGAQQRSSLMPIRLQVMCVSDYWVGCDRKIELRLKARTLLQAPSAAVLFCAEPLLTCTGRQDGAG